MHKWLRRYFWNRNEITLTEELLRNGLKQDQWLSGSRWKEYRRSLWRDLELSRERSRWALRELREEMRR